MFLYCYLMSIGAFLGQFPDDDACWAYLEQVRWSNGPVCRECGHSGPTSKVGRPHYHECRACRAKFTAAFDTPMEDLDRYCTEIVFRWNHRDVVSRLARLLGLLAPRLRWKALVA